MKIHRVGLTICWAVMLVFLMPTMSFAQDEILEIPSSLFVGDMTEAVFAEALEADVATSMALPGYQPFSGDMVNTETVGADGEGVYVAILDTGLVPQWPFLFSQANIAWHLGKGFSHSEVYWDPSLNGGYGDVAFGPLRDDRGYITGMASGHGSHVTSTVVGFNYNNFAWINGVAPKATIIPVLVLDAWLVNTPWGLAGLRGGTDEMITAGIYYIANLAPTLDAPVVINMSLGGPDRVPMIEEAIDYAIEKGVVIVVSAGNAGVDGMGYPGGMEQVISAGATGWASMLYHYQGWVADVPEKLNKSDILGNNRQIYLEDFSSRPNKDLDQKYQDLDVSAPGAWVVGPFKSAFLNDLNYYYLSGTSMAAPHVAGMAALVLQQHPGLGQADMESIMRNAATGCPLPASDAIVYYPWGDPPYYTAEWDGGDYGKGMLRADDVLRVADLKD